MRYRYEYNGEVMVRCPDCGYDLTTSYDDIDRIPGVLIEMTNGQSVHEVRSRLDSSGNLEDPTREVENGYHSATLCGNCEEMIMDYLYAEEIEV